MSETNREYLEKLIKEYRNNLSEYETDIIDNNLYSKMIKFDDDTISEYINHEYEHADEWEILKNNFSFSELDDLAKEQGIDMAVYDCFFNDVIKHISQDDIRAVAGLYALSWQDDDYLNFLSKEQIASIPDLCKDENVYDADDLLEDIDELVYENARDFAMYCEDFNLLKSMYESIGDGELNLKKVTLEDLQNKVEDLILDNFEYDSDKFAFIQEHLEKCSTQNQNKSSSIKM